MTLDGALLLVLLIVLIFTIWFGKWADKKDHERRDKKTLKRFLEDEIKK